MLLQSILMFHNKLTKHWYTWPNLRERKPLLTKPLLLLSKLILLLSGHSESDFYLDCGDRRRGEGVQAADQGSCRRRYSMWTFNRDISGLIAGPHLLPPFVHFLQTIVKNSIYASLDLQARSMMKTSHMCLTCHSHSHIFRCASISTTYPCLSVRWSVRWSHFRISNLSASLVALREKLKREDTNYFSILGLGVFDPKNFFLTQKTFLTRKTFLTQSLPSPNFFKPSVLGEVRVFRAFASLFCLFHV